MSVGHEQLSVVVEDQQLLRYGQHDAVHPVARPEPISSKPDLVLDGAPGEVETLADLRVGKSGAHQTENLELSSRQRTLTGDPELSISYVVDGRGNSADRNSTPNGYLKMSEPVVSQIQILSLAFRQLLRALRRRWHRPRAYQETQ